MWVYRDMVGMLWWLGAQDGCGGEQSGGDVLWGGCVLGWMYYRVDVFWSGCVLGWMYCRVDVFWSGCDVSWGGCAMQGWQLTAGVMAWQGGVCAGHVEVTVDMVCVVAVAAGGAGCAYFGGHECRASC